MAKNIGLAMQMFGKREKELTYDEYCEFEKEKNKRAAKRSMERRNRRLAEDAEALHKKERECYYKYMAKQSDEYKRLYAKNARIKYMDNKELILYVAKIKYANKKQTALR